MSDELGEPWESYLHVARDFDAACQGDGTWPPPIMTALVTAVQATTLRRLYPFTSHARLCLSAGPRCWEPGAVNAPAFVSLELPGLYNVWSGKPYRDAPTIVLTTEDPEFAAAEFERLLSGWSVAGL
jgi:hypothetical protein